MDPIIRAANAADIPGIVALIDAVYQEYGDRICLESADSDLLTAHEHYAAQGGRFIVLARGDEILGTHAVVPLAQPEICTFRRLYLDKSLRGAEWGERLMHWAIATARELQFSRVEFWSDTRFERAHRFFARLGFERDGRVRTMHDAFEPYQEYFFFKAL
ncbi:MAG TPA: GNAT family N-acetyltransferase [Pirellulaceae bacterium]|nr:GNAT family N-acetyltransferase [Pirellulaceae bacterium]